MKYLLLVLCLTCFCCSAAGAAPAASPTPVTQQELEDDFSPGLLFFALIAIAAMVVLAGLGIAAGLVIAGVTALLVVIGIFSTSAVIGFLRRRPGDAVRALLFQGAALAGIPCGIATVWVGRQIAHVHPSVASWVIAGALGGAAAGLLLALILNFAWGKLRDRFSGWIRPNG